MADDYLLASLRALCQRLSPEGDPLKGRYVVAKKAKLSEQYLYQILTGKPMANGNSRGIGKSAREKISKAYPYWLTGTEAATPLIDGQTAPSFVHPDALIQQVISLMESTDDAGRGIILMAATQAIEKYRPLKQTAA